MKEKIEKLIICQSTIKTLREYLMHSNVPIGECDQIFGILNFVEDGTCVNDSYFYPKELIDENLKKALEVF